MTLKVDPCTTAADRIESDSPTRRPETADKLESTKQPPAIERVLNNEKPRNANSLEARTEMR